jgi:hypothetical protein
MEDSMFDEQFVTTAEQIKEARKTLIELGKDVARHRMDADFNEAQIVFANANARMKLVPPGDDESNKAAEAANRRLRALFRRGWRRYDKLLFHCYREYKKRLCYHPPGRRLKLDVKLVRVADTERDEGTLDPCSPFLPPTNFSSLPGQA